MDTRLTELLPAGVALGGVDDQHVHTGLQQGRNSLTRVLTPSRRVILDFER